MSKRVLGKTWKKLGKKEQKYFVTLFASLLKHTYIAKIENYAKQKMEFKRQRIKGARSQVMTTLTDRNGTITVSYIMMLKSDV